LALTDSRDAVLRWKHVWETAWPGKDVEAIVALYAPNAVYRALAFREPDTGHQGVRDYLQRNFDVEAGVECWFGDPLVSGDRAAVEWWGTWLESGERVTLAGISVLRFDSDGLVTDHRDYWNQSPERVTPYESY